MATVEKQEAAVMNLLAFVSGLSTSSYRGVNMQNIQNEFNYAYKNWHLIFWNVISNRNLT